MSDTLYAGVARRIINPRLGINKNGLRLFADPIQAIESDLTATVLVVSNGSTRLAIIATDVCVIPASVSLRVREAVGRELDAPVSHVMLNSSHNHSAPAFPGWITDTPDQDALKTRYERDFTRWIVEAACEASSGLQRARIGAGWGECHIGVYRRETGPDGRDVLGEVPGAPIDPSVGVVRVDDLDGNPIAILFRYSCHPVVVGPHSMVASTDFPGPARDVIESSLGGTALFMQGCGGNINPELGIGWEVDCRDNKKRVGSILGGEALKVAAGIRTHVTRGPRTLMGNIPNILFTPWLPVDGPTCTFFGAIEEIVKLGFTQLPSLSEAEAIHARWQGLLEERQAGGSQDWEIRVATKFTEWSEKLVAAVRDGHPTVDLVLQVFRVNDIVLTGINMEAFFETGLSIRAQSPFKDTLVFGYTNGSLGYLPRAEDYPDGGWKLSESYAVPDLFVQSYSLPVALQPDAENLAIEHTARLIQRLA